MKQDSEDKLIIKGCFQWNGLEKLKFNMWRKRV